MSQILIRLKDQLLSHLKIKRLTLCNSDRLLKYSSNPILNIISIFIMENGFVSVHVHIDSKFNSHLSKSILLWGIIKNDNLKLNCDSYQFKANSKNLFKRQSLLIENFKPIKCKI
jgi:hypothetical protein